MKKIKGLVVGVGGQGIILFTRVLGEACLKADIPVIVSEVHGMAQRGGVVESSICLFGKSPYTSEGEADFIVAFEPAEALRFVKRAKKETKFVISKDPILPFAVKEGLATYPDLNSFFEEMTSYFSQVFLVPGEELAKEAGSVKALNMVMLGAATALEIFPLNREALVEAMLELLPEKLHQVNLKAFDLGFNYIKSIL
ncbi:MULTISPECIES: indolepyruvate oxidoreductase subunit beta [Thermodesulfobacterium]|jgi:indolepyruvate ferredoxin oxidoreductase beta subunit|uniref:Pyruvate ferredoxin oxidoreductase n=2 Tax=Thermodesulfobacterium commune TaxID=1741 RepID=A0A075WVQ5_9BACT|nr:MULTISPECIES: indolepyruvate oxidoreductase subunit beta [Thermodesulfobacterium]KUJ97354.1 MAG: Indolepyruvate ferredoxin oxidoreductase [Thermodesulfobacterium sp. 37_54]KUK19282.1 MAG: Indolepyruvate ferredoxin oxidoreductase [Thermodesulfobacterium commune]AIH04553.1 pyruvate ferredoxin oxidoreductase [Thermodesulfobacterium commune DSM 2178]KUK38052.1 MAG: Indolepyruvate ferredoxin oxidoreductase [Thermodesulfobacterium commune]MBZ4682122.1 pyruvate ferredoxin oxidoreductase [Thermodes